MGDEDGMGAEGDGSAPPPPPEPHNGKRIRNASMLAIVGSVACAPQKQDTDATLVEHKKAVEKKGTPGEDDSDEEAPEENELSVSFKNIVQGSETDTPEVAIAMSPEKRTSDLPGMPGAGSMDNSSLDKQVENNLSTQFELIEPWQMAAWLKSRSMREQILVVDVRGRDWVGGHIPSSINLHTSEVVRHPESLLCSVRGTVSIISFLLACIQC